MDAVKEEILSWWLKKVLLPFLGKRFPAFLDTLLGYLPLPRHGKEIILLRYVSGKDLVDGKLARALVGEKWPSLAGLIPERLFRLSEIADPLVKLLEGLKGKLQ